MIQRWCVKEDTVLTEDIQSELSYASLVMQGGKGRVKKGLTGFFNMYRLNILFSFKMLLSNFHLVKRRSRFCLFVCLSCPILLNW